MTDRRFIELQRSLIGHYSLERELGRGGMGTVYLARDVQLDRPVAIKVLHPELAARLDARERFLREAQTAARLAHPHIVPIYAVELRNDFAFIVMSLVDGESLGARIRRRGPLAPEDSERVLREIGWALSYAHARGVVHRDLTLENVLLERGTGRALLADFGLARESHTPETGAVIGTPAYLAPELIRGAAADPSADLYALGVVGFAVLSGRMPFDGPTPGVILAKHLVQPAPPLAPLARGSSARLIGAVEACLAKTPKLRPSDAATFLASLERAPEPVAVAPPLRAWFTRWDRIRPVYALATPLLAVQTYLLVAQYFTTGNMLLLRAALLEALLTLTLIPAAIQLNFELNELRRLRRAGLSIGDIRSAAPHHRAEVQRERRAEHLEPLASRVVFDLTAFGMVLLAVNLLFTYPAFRYLSAFGAAVHSYLSGLFFLSPEIYLGTMIGIGISLASPGYRLAPAGRVRRLIERFWESRFAGYLTRFASTGQRAQLAMTATLHRPTEMVLGLAVDDLWSVLPEELRVDIGDVPTLAHGLQGSAAEMRDLIDRLRDSERDVGGEPDELARVIDTRTALEARHRETVKTLEQLRLQLLRMLATRTRTIELTQQLEAARELELALMSDIAGHIAVRKLLRRRPHHMPAATPTPTPTPA